MQVLFIHRTLLLLIKSQKKQMIKKTTIFSFVFSVMSLVSLDSSAQLPNCPSATGVSVSTTTVCAGNPITLTATLPTGTNTVYWYTTPTGGTPIAISANTNTTYTPLTAGTYTYYAEAVGMGGINGTQNFAFTDSVQSVTLPVGTYLIESWGADGYTQTAGFNGRGGYASGTLIITTPQTYYIHVGKGGGYPTTGVVANRWNYNGGGIGYPNSNVAYGNGGGASDLRTLAGTWDDSISLTSRLIVAGGGGAGRSSAYVGGHGGGLTGANGTFFSPDQAGGPTGGSQTAGGSNTGYTSGLTTATLGKAMTWNGATLTATFLSGGGGGYYGGASGRVAGAGGSSYTGGVIGGSTIMFGQTGYVPNPSGNLNGYIRITAQQTCIPGPRVATAQVTVNPSPTVNLGTDISVCLDVTDSVILNADNTGNTILWNDNSTNQTRVVRQSGIYSVNVTNGIGCTVTDTIKVDFHDNPIVNLGADTSVCADQQVLLNAGNPGSRYLWNNNTTSSTRNITASGVYFVKVTDINNCSTTDSIRINHLVLPTAALGNDISVCKEQTDSITLDAGNVGDTYVWDDNSTYQTRTVFQTGRYNVTVTNNLGCIKKDTIVVNLNPSPIVNLGNDTTICVETSLVLNARNGGSTFLWDNNETARTRTITSAGTYTVAVTNNFNCTTSDTIIVTNFEIPQPNIGADTSICEGESIILSAGLFRNYVWSTRATTPTIEIKNDAIYYVTVKDSNNCMGRDTMELIITPRAYAEGFTYIPFFYEQFGKVQFSIINPASIARYEWDFGDGNTSTQISPVHTYATPGTYNVKLKIHGDHCDPRDYQQTINIELSGTNIDDLNFNSVIKIYPNPTSNVLNISMEDEKISVTSIHVVDVLGRTTQVNFQQHSNTLSTDVSHFASGIYNLIISTDKGIMTKKFEIKK